MRPYRLGFITNSGRYAQIAVCADMFGFAQLFPIKETRAALVFMSYKRMEQFWPAAEEKWGSDLSKLRETLREDNGYVPPSEYMYGRMVSASTRQSITQAKSLDYLGYTTTGLKELQERVDEIATPKRRRNSADQFDLTMLAITYAAILVNSDGAQTAADYLSDFMGQHDVGADYLTNLKINQAAYLAEAGHHRDALELLEPTYDEYRQGETMSLNYKVSGSDREFSWILACGHIGEGNAEKARPYLNVVETADELPDDAYLSETKRSSLIKMRFYRCTNDQDQYYSVWESSDISELSAVWLDFQRAAAKARFSGVRREWTHNSSRAQAIFADYRQLPERFTPALNGWAEE
ncbi:hypothetical protein GCM10023115_17540 [Pontixanthobacter gangjinensis]|uniref:Uncharacterized protein n=1 Tax=Pontixanthobacter gangjinensis TaxID=1028742 RepID=A0A6I4SMR9_9SPHN|nr:hypothetical protein [Pontixanthobacter gangjinensis]MXO56999.1 hypothetical protein [Pontixanthobacter gangjinensis]